MSWDTVDALHHAEDCYYGVRNQLAAIHALFDGAEFGADEQSVVADMFTRWGWPIGGPGQPIGPPPDAFCRCACAEYAEEGEEDWDESCGCPCHDREAAQ